MLLIPRAGCVLESIVQPVRAAGDRALAEPNRDIREGGTLTVTKLDRLARSVPDALDILNNLSARGVRFALGGPAYDWNGPFARMFLQILAVIAEFEANLIRQRTREGMDIARQKGKLRGRQPALSPAQDPGDPPHARQRRLQRRRDRRPVQYQQAHRVQVPRPDRRASLAPGRHPP